MASTKVKAFSVVSSADHPGAQRLARSARFWGWDHTFIIKQDQLDLRPPYKVWYPSYRAEQLGQLDFIRAHPEEEFLLYVDGWDTVFTGPPQELPLKRGHLSFGGDSVLYPEHTSQPETCFPTVGEHEFRFTNVGCVWGDAKVMAELAADYLQNSPEQMVNQLYFNRRFVYEWGVGRERLHIDTKARVMLNIMLTQKRHFDMRGPRAHYIPTDSYPLILHSPGQGRTFAEKAVPIPEELEKLYALD